MHEQQHEGAPAPVPSPAAGAARSAAPKVGIGSILAVLVIGVLAGAITTFMHRARIDIGFGPIWLGLPMAVLCLTLLTIGIHRTTRSAKTTWAFVLGALAVITVLALVQIGQSVIVAGDWVGIAWLVAPPICMATAASWPLPPEKPTPAPQPVYAGQPHPVNPNPRENEVSAP